MIEKTVYMFQSSGGKLAMLNYSMASGRWLIDVKDRFGDVEVSVFQTSRKTLDGGIQCLKEHWPDEEWSEY